MIVCAYIDILTISDTDASVDADVVYTLKPISWFWCFNL